jgi:HD-GYP domain-containing protein (c-di-GMP phosphodiesterase class II)
MTVTEDLKELETEMDRLTLRLWLELNKKEDCDFTSNHLYNTAIYAGYIVGELDIEDDLAKKIVWGAKLHDAGKIFIENDVLLHKRPFTEKDRDEVKKHPEYGIKWLQENTKIELPKEILSAVKHHHELWSGQGYPGGLEGAKIPFSARVVAVADVWDSKTAKGVYSKYESAGQAARYLRKNAITEKRYDATAVNALLIHLGWPATWMNEYRRIEP